MKKATVLILTLIYLAVSTGVVVNLHYCMNKLSSCQLYKDQEKKTCGKCGMHKSNSNKCCRDEVKIVKMEEDQRLSQAVLFDFTTPAVISQLPSAFLSMPFYNAGSHEKYNNHSPPLPDGQDTYLLNSVFRI